MNTLSMTTIQCGSELILCYGIVSVVYGRIHLKSLKKIGMLMALKMVFKSERLYVEHLLVLHVKGR